MTDEKIIQTDNMNQEYSHLEAQESAKEYLSNHSHHWGNTDNSAINPNLGDLTTEEKCKKFSECLTVLALKEIQLDSHESLIPVTAENWQLIGKHLQNSRIQKASLVNTSLEKFNLASLHVFLNICFTAPHVKYSCINFSLFAAEPAKWAAFCHAITTSKSSEICFEACQLSQLNSQQREEFLEALKLSTIKKIDILQDAVSQTFKNDLDEILQKNQKQKEIEAAEYLSKHSHNFIGFKNPEFRPNIDNLTTEENCKQFADCLKILDIKKWFLTLTKILSILQKSQLKIGN